MAVLSSADALAAANPLIAVGLAVHWLRPKSKAPYHDGWNTRPVHTATSLREEYRGGFNLGVRCGEPSKTDAGYLAIIDIDISKSELVSEAWTALDRLLPNWRLMPTAISGSGGDSRHIYIFTPEPLQSIKLAKSEGFAMVWSEEKQKDVKKRNWEIDLKGTDAQVVLPPSIHPETDLPYRWERPLDLLDLELGFAPKVDLDRLGARSAVADEDDEDAEYDAALRKVPIGLDEEEIARTLRDLPPEWVEDRDLWFQAGMALHHEYEGADAGREVWFEWSKQSDKFDAKDAAKVWRSFKNRTLKPVRMPTLIQAAGQHRVAQALADLDELEDLGDLDAEQSWTALPATIDDIDDLLGPIGRPEPVDPTKNPDKDWTRLLAITDEGEIKVCLHNIEVIVQNDARLYGRIGFNELGHCPVVMSEPALLRKKSRDGKPIKQLDTPIWVIGDNRQERLNGKRWTDYHSNALRSIIEAPKTQGGYALKVSDRDLTAGISNVARAHAFHPIRDKLLSLTWDGKPRAERLFIDYLAADDDAYHREAARLTLLGAVARAFCPGHKFDFVPILEGTQGKGKSTFISILGMDWYSELSVDFHDNNKMIEALQGSWIIEIPELQGFSKAETTTIKAFVSRTKDKGRLAWERHVQEFLRQCIFIGSTNDDDYLRDATGGRRFWPIRCRLEGNIDTARLRREIGQIWAEAVHWWHALRAEQPRGDLPLYMKDEDAAATALVLQDSRRTETPEELLAAEMRAALDMPKSTDLDGTETPRTVTCIKEVWVDLLNRDQREMTNQVTTRLIGKALRMAGWKPGAAFRHPRYGVQKAYKRIDT